MQATSKFSPANLRLNSAKPSTHIWPQDISSSCTALLYKSSSKGTWSPQIFHKLVASTLRKQLAFIEPSSEWWRCNNLVSTLLPQHGEGGNNTKSSNSMAFSRSERRLAKTSARMSAQLRLCLHRTWKPKRVLSISECLTMSENEYGTLTTVMDSNYWIGRALLRRH